MGTEASLRTRTIWHGQAGTGQLSPAQESHALGFVCASTVVSARGSKRCGHARRPHHRVTQEGLDRGPRHAPVDGQGGPQEAVQADCGVRHHPEQLDGRRRGGEAARRRVDARGGPQRDGRRGAEVQLDGAARRGVAVSRGTRRSKPGASPEAWRDVLCGRTERTRRRCRSLQRPSGSRRRLRRDLQWTVAPNEKSDTSEGKA